MNLSYYRKSNFSLKETLDNVRKNSIEAGLTFIGVTDLPSGNGMIVHVTDPLWLGNLIASDANLIGLLPTSVAIISGTDGVKIGTGSPSVLGGVSQNPAISQLASKAETVLKELINKSAGVAPLKPVGIKLYSTTTCPYCKMEASWLTEKKVKFEEVKVDQNQAEAEEMVKKTGQMGVPVTAVSYENGEEEYIVGFDKLQLSRILEVS